MGMTLRLWLQASAFVLVATAIAGGSAAAMEPGLEKIQRYIEKRHQEVRHVSADAFAALDKDTLVVFDVRKAEEYEVSHIENAIRVDPDVKPANFINQHGGRLNGKTVVFYCSVGRRSSALVSRIDDLVQAKHAKASYNLAGGLFHWRNEKRPLMSNGQATTSIHPYNIFWGRLIEDKEAIRFTPVRPPAPNSGKK